MPMAEALRVAQQIASALEAAHDTGHRPSRLEARQHQDHAGGHLEGARLRPREGSRGRQLVARRDAITYRHGRRDEARRHSGDRGVHEPGAGPGKPVDKRTDIWAFGCVLYEMLTARAAFQGATITDTLAAILERDPDWTALPANTPAPIHRLLRRSLEKDRRHRIADASDARLEIEEALAAPMTDANLMTNTGPPSRT
jgi:hypothetical protein